MKYSTLYCDLTSSHWTSHLSGFSGDGLMQPGVGTFLAQLDPAAYVGRIHRRRERRNEIS